jgi:uncharacterized small protein (DUF1192 family)
MLFDEELPQKGGPAKPKPLANMSIAELETYIVDLKAEIARVETEIGKKKSHAEQAAAFFGKKD